jgi:hypothetical protein
MSTFVEKMDGEQKKLNNLVKTENGDVALKSSGDNILNLFYELVRGLSKDNFEKSVNEIMKEDNPSKNSEIIDLFVMMFQTRDIRGGKGERELFLLFFRTLYNSFPDTCLSLLKLVPDYGCFRDLKNLYASLNEDEEILQSAIVEMFAEQLLKDSENHSSYLIINKFIDGIPPSNAAKWCPKEGRTEKHKDLYKALVKKMFPDSKTPNKEYRKLVKDLGLFLDIVEVKMCAKNYADIKLQSVPSLAMNKYKSAFLNKKIDGTPLTECEFSTGNRFPNDPDRVKCRENFLQILTNPSENIKGKDLFAHEIIKNFLNGIYTDGEDLLVINGQWQAMKQAVIEGIESFNEFPKDGAINLGKLLPLCDVSPSMEGTPMDVCIALGILISELSENAFANRILTFETDPKWVDLSDCKNLREKVESLKKSSWGGSTNIDKAFARIVNVIKEYNLSEEDIPDLIIFSDMQFDEANKDNKNNKNKDVLQERLEKKFAKVGIEISGKPYKVPRIIYWNLRPNTTGFPVESSTLNTQLLSGYSPSLFKLILSGEPLEIEEVSESGVVIKRQNTPLETVRKCLDDTRYDDVRIILSESSEGLLSEYSFTPAERIDEPVEETD